MSGPLSVVTWLWGRQPQSPFGPEHVNLLYRGLRRHLRAPFTFTAITDHDDLSDFCDGVLTYPMMLGHAEMRAGNRSCFRRLALLAEETSLRFGPRVLQLDLDTVVVGDVTPLFTRAEPLVLCAQNRSGARTVYNPSAMLMDAGVLDGCWREFDAAPHETWQAAKRAGWSCSDMSVINHYVSRMPAQDPRRPATWEPQDGMLAYWRDIPKDGRLPPGARMVLFYGMRNPHDADVRQRCPWIAEHWL